MAKNDIKRASLSDIKKMKAEGQLYHNPNAPEDEDLGAEFWANAQIVNPQEKTSVHLRLDKDVYDFFKSQGKGHVTKMQAVLRSYVEAHKPH